MKLLLLLLALAFAASNTNAHTHWLSEHLVRAQWEEFKIEHDKNYRTPQEEELRMRIFVENLMTIANHNRLHEMGLSTYTMGMNQFGDLTEEEFYEYYQMPYSSLTADEMMQDQDQGDWEGLRTHHDYVSFPLPKKLDWRLLGAVTRVKNQNPCAGCYSFSAVGSLESQHYLATKELIALSEQNILDCTYRRKQYPNRGCLGGRVDISFRYIRDNGGIDSEASYPYLARVNRNCQFNESNVAATLRTYVNIQKGNETDLQVAVAWIGPVSVMADGQGMQFYSGGLYDNPKCSSTKYSHGMVVVGFGQYKTLSYWLVKNSWGPKWGENGYILMKRNSGNQCAIATAALYPLV